MRSGFGKRASALRAEKNLSLRAFAKSTGFAPSTISNLERGRDPISDDVLSAYIRVLGLSGEDAHDLRIRADLASAQRDALKQGNQEDAAKLSAMVAVFADSMPKETLERLRNIIERDTGARFENLFLKQTALSPAVHRKRRQAREALRPERLAAIVWLATCLRRRVTVDRDSLSPSILLDRLASLDLGFDYEVANRWPAKHAPALAVTFATATEITIRLREHDLESNRAQQAYLRYIISHELGHVFLHGTILKRAALRSEGAMLEVATISATAEPGQLVSEDLTSPEEIEADMFATALAVPFEFFFKGTDINYLAKDFGLPEGKVKAFARLFLQEPVLNVLRGWLWEMSETEHPIFGFSPPNRW